MYRIVVYREMKFPSVTSPLLFETVSFMAVGHSRILPLGDGEGRERLRVCDGREREGLEWSL